MLRPERNEIRQQFDEEYRKIIEATGTNIAGMAIVTWDENNKGCCQVVTTKDNKIPLSLLPEFAKTRILWEIVENYSVRRVEDEHQDWHGWR